MYGVELYAAVRLAVVDEGLSHHEAGRRFGIDRRTVKKMLSYSAPPGYRRTKPVRRPKLDGFTGIVDAILEADTDPDVPRKQRHTAHRIFERLRDEHEFTGGYTIVAVPFEACEHVPGQISSTALVRYRLVDYSAPTVHAHKKVMVKGYVDRVEIALGAEIVARHRRSYVRGDVIYDPLHYLSLLEKKPGALDQAAPLRGWKLDPAFDTLRRLLEARFGPRGKREYIQVLRLHEDFPARQVAAAVRDAVKRRLIGFDAVKHLLLARIERRPVHLDLSRYPHLPRPFVAATRSADYATLLAAGHG